MADTALKSYDVAGGTGGSGNHEDLMDLIVNISPIETPMFSEFGKSTANGVLHEWLQDSLATPAANANVEGATTTYAVPGVRTRVGNYTQILDKPVEVSRTQRKINPAGIADEFNYQVEKAMKELARDIEYAIVNGTGNSGASGTARELKGVISFVTSNVVTGTGTGTEALTESMYNDLLQAIFNAGGNPDVTYANGWQKRKIDAFTTPNTRYLDASDGKLNAAVGVYQSSFGLQQIILDRFMPTDKVAALEKSKWKVAVLDGVHYEDRAKDGDSDKGVVIGELTLEALQEAANGQITQLTTS